MLRYLRENTGNWIIKIFLGIIVIVFVFLGVGSFGSKQKDSIATINDDPITIKEYQQAYQTIVAQLQARFGTSLNEDLIKAFNVKQQALDTLIEQKLLIAEAEKLDIVVSDQELQNYLLSIKAFQKDGLFDLSVYKKVLGQSQTNPELFEENQLMAMKLQKVKNLVYGGINVTDAEAREFYLHQNTQMAVDYIHIQPSTYTKIKPGSEEVQAFFSDNKENYKSEKKLKVSYIKFSPADYQDKVNVTEANIKEYYEQNIETFKTPEKVEARHILVRLEPEADEITTAMAEQKAQDIYKKAAEGQDFQKLAKELSEGPSKESGGYLGTFDRTSMVKPFADAVFAMKPGEISKPVKTQFGLHIIKLIAKFEASVQTLSDTSQKIKLQIEKEELQNIAYDLAGEAFDAVIDGDDFEQVARIVDKPILKTGAFDVNGNGLNIANSAAFAKEAFALSSEEISDVKQFGSDYYLIKITDHIEPAIQEFDAVASRVEQDLTKKMQKDKALNDAKALIERVMDKKSLHISPLPNSLTVKSTPLFMRNGTIEGISDPAKIIEAAFTLNKENPVYETPIEVSAGYYLVAFKEVKRPEMTDIRKSIDTIKQDLIWQKQNQSYQAWLDQLKQEYTIKYDPAVMN